VRAILKFGALKGVERVRLCHATWMTRDCVLLVNLAFKYKLYLGSLKKFGAHRRNDHGPPRGVQSLTDLNGHLVV
jgi:hypothetical protein